MRGMQRAACFGPPTTLRLPHLRQARESLRDLAGGIGRILQLASEVLVVRGKVEVAVAAEVEEDDPPLTRLLGRQRLIDGCPNGVSALRRWDNPLGPGELKGRVE